MSTRPRPWDSFDAYLFDIDGTLLHCRDAVHYFAFCDVLTAIAGRPLNLDGVITHGNTDTGILRDALRRAGVPDDTWRPRLGEIRRQMCERVALREQEMCVEMLPQVKEILQGLRARGAVLGVATGNLETIGTLKLRRAGLLAFFSFAGWSDACEDRAQVFRGAVALARSLAGQNAAVCVVGDTPADVLAARANDLCVIAVATGIHSRDELQAAGPDWCVSSLRELTFSAQPLAA
jgi:phosphoglycolate phosphatase-like HAD superfamily hydrolase